LPSGAYPVTRPGVSETGDNGFVPIIHNTVVEQQQIAKAIARVEQMLKPDVVRIKHSIGNDSSGEPAVYFRILLADAASRPDRLREVSNRVRSLISQKVDPLNSWGLIPYLRFRSQSEQAEMQEAAWA
jgi:hypothetical protein